MNQIRLLCVLLIMSMAFNVVAQSTLSRLTVQANQFVDETGQAIFLKGLNASDPDKLEKEGQWHAAYFQEMKSWGANAVRFPIHPRAWNRRGEKAYLKLLDQGIAWAESAGLYVILDWHSIGNLPTGRFQHHMYETTTEQTFAFWEIMASRYGNHPAVAFYELYNEPTTNKGAYGTCSWAEWKGLMEKLIDHIRVNGGQGIPLVAGFNWAYDLTPVRIAPLNREGIGYVSHPYPQKRAAPWPDKWTEDWGFVKDIYPVILTEIGFAGEEEEGAHIPVISDESYGEAITSYCEKKGISYVLWVFDPDWAPGLFSDWDYTLTRHGRYFKERWQSP